MNDRCSHRDQIRNPDPSSDGCEDCLKTGDSWIHLRMCLSCGHVGCCESSKNRHAWKHFEETARPLIQSAEPGETWRWCYVDETYLSRMVRVPDVPKRLYEYEGRDVTVLWDQQRCIHAEACIRGLPKVFDKDRQPWIDPGQGSAAQRGGMVALCRCGASQSKPYCDAFHLAAGFRAD